MEYIGRMAEITLCIICLTLAPAGSMMHNYEKQKQNQLTVQAEMLCGKIRQNGVFAREEYSQFCRMMKRRYPDYAFEIMIARKYVMPVQNSASAAGMPVKILYRTDIEEMLAAGEEIVMEGTVFVSISIYGKDNFFYTCGGEVW